MSTPLSRRDLLHAAIAGTVLLGAPGLLLREARASPSGSPSPTPALGDGQDQDERVALLELWCAHFGYYTGEIDLSVGGDLREFTHADCTLTAHAPLWGTKEGEEEAIPATEVRERLAKTLKRSRITRERMHLALHPDGKAASLFFVVKIRLRGLPMNLMTVPLAFVVDFAETPDGLRISEIHEWPAETPADAVQTLMAEHGWPEEPVFEAVQAFGAVS